MEIICSFHLGLVDKRKPEKPLVSFVTHLRVLTLIFSVQFYVLYCVSLFLS